LDINQINKFYNSQNSNKRTSLVNTKFITYLGRINWKKGLDSLIKAYSLLMRKRKDLSIVIAGNDDGYKRNLINLINENKLTYKDLSNYNDLRLEDKFIFDENIIFFGQVLDHEKYELLSLSDLFVLPSYSENYGMVVIEAMA